MDRPRGVISWLQAKVVVILKLPVSHGVFQVTLGGDNVEFYLNPVFLANSMVEKCPPTPKTKLMEKESRSVVPRGGGGWEGTECRWSKAQTSSYNINKY